jgi:hypothetical protein
VRKFGICRGTRGPLTNITLVCALAAAPMAPGGARAGGPLLASSPGHAVAVTIGGTASFQPSLLVRVGDTGGIMVLGTNDCNGHLCPQLWQVSGGGRTFTRLALPPGARAPYPGLVEGVGSMVFANGADGYAVAGPGTGAGSYFTSDGARAWRRLPSGLAGSLSDVVATNGSFYGLVSACTSTSKGVEYCSYRLGRSPVGEPDWRSAPLPGAERVLPGYTSLAAHGTEVWTYINPLKAGAVPVIVKSVDGARFFSGLAFSGLAFSELPEPELVSVASCGVALMTATTAWVTCPTGMMVSWFRTTDGGHHFTAWWETAGTGGDAFDPLSATAAYRYTGDVGPGTPHLLERTTDGGATFRSVAHLPFSGGSQVEIAFLDEDHGYVLGWESRPGDVEAGHMAVLFTATGGRHWQVVFAG